MSFVSDAEIASFEEELRAAVRETTDEGRKLRAVRGQIAASIANNRLPLAR